jgi:Tfp pilus assembly protein PilX
MKKVRAGRRSPRGMTLLIALAVISVVTAATLVSLRVVSQESELQGRERHSREAFFAAEAGLAEGREVLTLLLSKHSAYEDENSAYQGKASNFTDVMLKLGTLSAAATGFNNRGEVNEANFPGTGRSWYEVIPNTPYTLLPGVGQAVDPNVSTATLELRAINSKPFLSYPEQRNVTYRVFVHDDEDEGAFVTNDPRIDNNHAVWVVSVGEVRGTGEVVLARSVVRALVFADPVSPLTNPCTFQKVCGPINSGRPLPKPSKDIDLSQGTKI